MKWYISKIVFQIICGNGQHTAQFDEQLRLIQAADAEAAFHKATALGRSESETFYNQKEQLVQWKFIDVSDLYPLSLIDSGELVSKIEEVTDAEIISVWFIQNQNRYSKSIVRNLCNSYNQPLATSPFKVSRFRLVFTACWVLWAALQAIVLNCTVYYTNCNKR
jgi:hypothetical protein